MVFAKYSFFESGWRKERKDRTAFHCVSILMSGLTSRLGKCTSSLLVHFEYAAEVTDLILHLCLAHFRDLALQFLVSILDVVWRLYVVHLILILKQFHALMCMVVKSAQTLVHFI